MHPSPVIDLRNLLASRFPHLRQNLEPRPAPPAMPTGVPGLDALLSGGLPRGEFAELVAAARGSGSAEVIHQLLRTVAANRQFLALVDGMGSFDVGAVEPATLNRLLWVRCQKVTEALTAADLLLRDRNFPVVVLDLKLNPVRDLRKIISSTWHRYVRLLEQNQATVLVITPLAFVTVAAVRIVVDSELDIDALNQSRSEILSRLRFKLAFGAHHSAEVPMEGLRLRVG